MKVKPHDRQLTRYRNYLDNVFNKMLSKNFEIADVLLYGATPTFFSLTVDDIIGSTLLNCLEKANTRLIEKTLLNFVETRNAAPSFTLSTSEILLMKKQNMDCTDFCDSVVKVIDQFVKVKIMLHSLISNLTLSDDELFRLWDVLYGYTQHNGAYKLREHDFNGSVITAVIENLVVISLIFQRKNFPLYRKSNGEILYWKFTEDGFDFVMKNLFSSFKKLDSEKANAAQNIITAITGGFCANFLWKVAFVKENCNDITVRLFDTKSCIHISDVVCDNQHNQYLDIKEDIKIRKAMLPACGIEVLDVKIDNHSYNSIFVHELVTDDDVLFLIFEVVSDIGSIMLIYDVIGGEFVCSGATSAFSGGNDDMGIYTSFDSAMSFELLKIYQAAIKHYEQLVVEKSGEAKILGRHMRENRKLYEEFIQVNSHTRKLADGWAASCEAVESARRIGLILKDDETYVRTYIRKVHRATFEDAVKVPKRLDLSEIN